MAVLMYPLSTEKAISLIDKENVIVYVTDMRATKPEIRKEFESMFNVKVKDIRIVNTATNTKKAYIKIAKGYKATDVATKLKLI
ncbi:MAG: 50S ribosomal protein L23 [Candidatus Micrarchaeia archaeon]